MTIQEYLLDPCSASSLPFWKAERISIPENMRILREDELLPADCVGFQDEAYFKLYHDLQKVIVPLLPSSFEIVSVPFHAYAAHIRTCYEKETISDAALEEYQGHPSFDEHLWVAVIEKGKGQLVASGIGELDRRIGEGILEWIQVSPAYRRQGLGNFVVCELLSRMQNRAKFVTVSGRAGNQTNPLALYEHCGFTKKVIWHVLTKAPSS